jgi:predicted DNA-binding transcriptional regulator AlpA
VGRKLDVDQLVGAVEIAERLRVSAPTVVHNWRDRYEDFPAPVVVRTRAILWYWPEIEAWARRTRRLPQ